MTYEEQVKDLVAYTESCDNSDTIQADITNFNLKMIKILLPKTIK